MFKERGNRRVFKKRGDRRVFPHIRHPKPFRFCCFLESFPYFTDNCLDNVLESNINSISLWHVLNRGTDRITAFPDIMVSLSFCYPYADFIADRRGKRTTANNGDKRHSLLHNS